MTKRSPEVDAYIAKAAPFARPILKKLRRAFHDASPSIEETIKWGNPFFDYKGIVGFMAAFKSHVNWGFWKAKLMRDPAGILKVTVGETSMGGSKLADVSELPSERVLIDYIRQAVRLNEEGVKIAKPRAKRKAGAVVVPDDLAAALRKNRKARATFESFPPSHQREYVEWITEAKQEATRSRRLATTLEWLAEGKRRNWKYMKKVKG